MSALGEGGSERWTGKQGRATFCSCTGSSGQLQSRVKDMCLKVLNSNDSLLEVKSDRTAVWGPDQHNTRAYHWVGCPQWTVCVQAREQTPCFLFFGERKSKQHKTGRPTGPNLRFLRMCLYNAAFPEKKNPGRTKEEGTTPPLSPGTHTVVTTPHQLGLCSGPSYDLNEAHRTNIVWCHLLFYISRNLASFEIL